MGKGSQEVLRVRRLEIVDEEGKVRAELGTREDGIGGLSVFDASGRKRAALEAGEVPGQGSGLSVLDTEGRPRAVVSTDNDPDKGAALILLDTDGKHRAVLSLQAGGEAGLAVSAGDKDRAIKVVAGSDGQILFTLSRDDIPMIGLALVDEEGEEPLSYLMLTDANAQARVALCGRRSGSFVRFADASGEVRAGLELADNGELDVTSFGGEERFARRGNRPLNFFWAFVFCVLIIGGAFVGVWVAELFSNSAGGTQAGPGLPFFVLLAILISGGIAALVTFLDYLRQR